MFYRFFLSAADLLRQVFYRLQNPINVGFGRRLILFQAERLVSCIVHKFVACLIININIGSFQTLSPFRHSSAEVFSLISFCAAFNSSGVITLLLRSTRFVICWLIRR
jgi:hypothetical protein